MAGRMQKDRFKKSPRGNISTITWVSPGRSQRIPCNALEVVDCKIGAHYIAREKKLDGTWHIRPSYSGKETFYCASLQFLVANRDKVCWQKGSINRIPDDAVMINDGPLNKPNTFIGKNIDEGVGQVIFQNESTFAFLSASDKVYENNYDVLCILK